MASSTAMTTYVSPRMTVMRPSRGTSDRASAYFFCALYWPPSFFVTSVIVAPTQKPSLVWS